MKKLKLIILTIITIFITDFAYSIDPTYTLKISQPINISQNIVEFDIYLKHTNPTQTNFYYSMGQYVIYVPTVCSQGGTLTYTIVSSDLPTELRPLNPSVFITSKNIQLRLAPNVPPASYPGQANPLFSISSIGQGTKIAHMRLSTSAAKFGSFKHLDWKNSGDYFTKIINNNFSATQSLVKNITNPVNHITSMGFATNTNNIIGGKVFFDNNSNGVQDSGEPGYTGNYSIVVRNSSNTIIGSTHSKNNGYYCHHITQAGNFTISISGFPAFLTANPAIQLSEFGGLGFVDDFNDFALSTVQNVSDVRVSLASFTQRPGFTAQKYLTYQNIGTGSKTGTIQLNHDSRLTFLGSSDPFTYNQSAHTIQWSYPTINPGVSRVITMTFYSPPSTPLGTRLSSTATIFPFTGDARPANNVYTLNEIVKGSFDPNDISVEPSGNITSEEVTNEDSLTYTIRFQNTGTDTAFTVRIADTLSPNLNPETIEILSSSHDYSYEIDENGVAEFTFNYILLPDSTTDEPGSHGFIQYSIKPKNTLVLGDSIKNTAYIYFDFNEPVVTNTVNTVVGIRNTYLDLKWRLQAMFPLPDTISVKLRNAFAPYDAVDSLTVSGDVSSAYYSKTMEFENIQPGNAYYISVSHRNSIETWSADPVVFYSDTTEYDFTTSLSQAYGNNMINIESVASFYCGDVNQDGIIELSDLLLTFNDASEFHTGVTDLNGDGITDLNDLLIVFNNASTFIHVIKP